MSKTDKTNPTWVKIKQGLEVSASYIYAVHNHADGVCDLEVFDPREQWVWRRGRCRAYLYSDPGDGFAKYRHPRALKLACNQRERSERRRVRDALRGRTPCDFEDVDLVQYRSRHSAWWDVC